MTATETRAKFRSLGNEGTEPCETFKVVSDLCVAAGLHYATTHYVLAWSMLNTLWLSEREDTGEIIGVLMSMTLDLVDVFKWNHLLPTRKQIHSNQPAHYLADSVVAEEYRNRRVAQEMLCGALKYARVIDEVIHDTAYALARVPASGETSGTSYNILKTHLGFEEVYRFSGFYKDSDRFTCPTCNDASSDKQVCSCEARLMMRNSRMKK
jgi:ribosomal protein S18 acetylase RimI-like enzyme